MENILSQIVAHKRLEVAARQARRPAAEVRDAALEAVGRQPRRPFAAALAASPTGIIAEFKRKSPSLGWIKPEARVEDIVARYERAGATALSVLADETYFGGSLDFIRRARTAASLPVLCKEFIVDDYQILEAAEAGADAVLLIAACLDVATCRRLAATARGLGLDVLLEIHNEQELAHAGGSVSAVGVNNRDLRTFHTDIATSLRLAPHLPGTVRVSESGLREPADVARLRRAGFRGFLMGERWMTAARPEQELHDFIARLSCS